jgi:hypothetical protein
VMHRNIAKLGLVMLSQSFEVGGLRFQQRGRPRPLEKNNPPPSTLAK